MNSPGLYPQDRPPPIPAQLSAGESLRIGFGAWLRNFLPFTLISLVLHGPFLYWAFTLRDRKYDVEAWRALDRWTNLFPQFVGILLSAMVIYAVVNQLDGKPAPFGRMVGVGLRRFLPAFLVAFLTGLIVALFTLLLIIPGLMAMCALYVATPASVVERPGIFGALRRSRELTKGSRWSVFGLVLLSGIITMITMLVIHGVVFGFGDETRHLMPAASLGTSLLLSPLNAAIVAATYVILRRERDGVDANELARIFE